MAERANVFDLRNGLWGGKRFYTPGNHPAMARHREQRRRIEAVQEAYGTTPDLDAALDWMREQEAMFEEGESIAKVHADAQLNRGRRDA